MFFLRILSFVISSVFIVSAFSQTSFAAMPQPAGTQYYSYPSAASPSADDDPANAKPIGVGTVATGADTVRLEIKVGYARDSCDVMVDRNKILQVLTNLTHNAIKYSSEGSMVEIRVKNSDGCIITEVEDHGKGIPEEDLPRIFEKFYQSRYTRGHGGIGLGLAISRGIVDAHGDIDIRQARR